MNGMLAALFIMMCIALVCAVLIGAVKALFMVLEAVRSWICHEMLMRPKYTYFRWEVR